MFKKPETKEEYREATTRVEQEINKYLERTLHKALMEEKDIIDVSFRNRKEEQCAGIDAVITKTDGTQVCIDYKAKMTYVNESKNTFAFELFYNDRQGVRKKGTGLESHPCNNTFKADYFGCVDKINASVDNWWEITADNITSIDVMYISPTDLFVKLADKGISENKLISLAKDAEKKFGELYTPEMTKEEINNIRRYGIEGFEYYPRGSETPKYNTYFYVSAKKNDLHFEPTSIVFAKRYLEHLLNTKLYTVTPDETHEVNLTKYWSPPKFTKQRGEDIFIKRLEKDHIDLSILTDNGRTSIKDAVASINNSKQNKDINTRSEEVPTL